MRITDTMDLGALAERMGGTATIVEAAYMRDALDGLGRWERTEDVPADEWEKILDGAVAQAAQVSNYALCSIKGGRDFCGTLDEAIEAAKRLDATLQPAMGVTVEFDGTICATVDGDSVEVTP